MERKQFIKFMADSRMYDLTQGCSIFTPPWPGEKALEVHFFKRVTGAYGGGQGAKRSQRTFGFAELIGGQKDTSFKWIGHVIRSSFML